MCHNIKWYYIYIYNTHIIRLRSIAKLDKINICFPKIIKPNYQINKSKSHAYGSSDNPMISTSPSPTIYLSKKILCLNLKSNEISSYYIWMRLYSSFHKVEAWRACIIFFLFDSHTRLCLYM